MYVVNKSGDTAKTCSSSTIDQTKPTIPFNSCNELRLNMRFTQFTDLNATILKASQQVIAESNT